MQSRLFGLIFVLTALACGPKPGAVVAPLTAEAVVPTDGITALAYDANGESVWLSRRASSGCTVESAAAGAPAVSRFTLPRCPDRIVRMNEDWLIQGNGFSEVRSARGELLSSTILGSRGEWTLSWVGSTLKLEATGREPITIPASETLRWVRPLASGAVLAVRQAADGESIVRLDGNSTEALTPSFAVIDSYDVAPDEKEFVFSAKREKGFDVGLAPTKPGEVRWVPAEVHDETAVTWAPRGNKISYRFSTSGVTFFRTVHVGTGFQLTFGVPAVVRGSVAWDPRAERFAFVTESAGRSPEVRVATYNGEEQKTLVTSRRTLSSAVDAVQLSGRRVTIIRPQALRYGERLPLVVWLTRSGVDGWNESRADLAASTRVAQVVIDELAERLDSEMWAQLEELAGVDGARIFVVAADETSPRLTGVKARAVISRGPGNGRGGHGVTRKGGQVLVLADTAEAHVVESLAARYIADQLKDIDDRG